ncbi:MAG: hypothetical protein RSF82_00725 [Angelakisella sp.]
MTFKSSRHRLKEDLKLIKNSSLETRKSGVQMGDLQENTKGLPICNQYVLAKKESYVASGS